jgi:NAD(P)-dependent dehydrogenase (short-subunit alcohol dehydrogenase family)
MGTMKNLLVTLAVAACLPLGALPAHAQENTTVLITGANRGIGLEFARQLAAKGHTVIGTARKPERAAELKDLGVRVEQLDVTDPGSVTALAARLDGTTIDILINNAGIFDRTDTSLENIDFGQMEKTLAVNTLGPLRVAQALLPNLEAGGRKTIVNISSRLGSITHASGRWYSYRASKAALNMATKLMSQDLEDRGFLCVVLHPGWVRTDLGGSNATYSTEESVTGMLKVIGELTSEQNGGYFDLTGEALPW